MTLQYVRGDMFSSSSQVLVIPVNCRGVAGCGVALQAKQRYPEWFHEYRSACQHQLLQIGWCRVHSVHGDVRRLVSFPTKDDWRAPSQLAYIEKGLVYLTKTFPFGCVGYRSLALPKLGVGAGGLRWADVKPLMECYLSSLPCDIQVYV